MEEYRITTIDNPHSPFDEFKPWLAFDTAHGYNTTELLAKISFSSEELSEADQIYRNNVAVDEILEEDITGMYMKVVRNVSNKYVSED